MDSETTFAKTLYYSVVFPEQYNSILKYINHYILNEQVDSTKGIFVKKENDVDHYFGKTLLQDDKNSVLKKYQKSLNQLKV